eukprot:6199296-Pleurochrysis_carterae.AAC.2
MKIRHFFFRTHIARSGTPSYNMAKVIAENKFTADVLLPCSLRLPANAGLGKQIELNVLSESILYRNMKRRHSSNASNISAQCPGGSRRGSNSRSGQQCEVYAAQSNKEYF